MSSYPFVGNPYAQSSVDKNHRDPYSTSSSNQYAAPYPPHPSHSHAGHQDGDDVDDYIDSRERYHEDQVYHKSGGIDSPTGGPAASQGYDGGAAATMPVTDEKYMAREEDDRSASAYRGNSIWSQADRGAFKERSVPARCFRVIFCVLIIAIIFVLSIVCLIVTFARPPNVAITGVGVPSQSGVSYTNGAFSFNVTVDITVSNPNSISATVKKLSAKAYDKADRSTSVGSGEIRNKKISPHLNTTIEFPFQIKYDQSQDTDYSIIKDIAAKCGIGGGATSNLEFTLDVSLDISVLSIAIPVSFSHDVSFACPLSGSSLEQALGNLGSILGGSLSTRSTTASRRMTLTESAWEGREANTPRNAALFDERGEPSTFAKVMAATDALVRRYAGLKKGELAHDSL
ncbi:hypothetical protein IE53DRAFT_389375 [Violaceomyces palustris]|uniref:Uncharacterized protein n=1 Tax=Violaceomyces palustris TaxID=1673888 RepID=A0ACD0NRK0_9BASI|nr:hypothetical protein IE53DRAFT_389375 [Violaceomyces palustris]